MNITRQCVAGVVVALLAFTGCGGGSFSDSQADSEVGLRIYISQHTEALSNLDFEALHRLQGPNCDYSLAEVTEAFQQMQALVMVFSGMTIGEMVADIDFDITSFDEDSLTATVTSTYVGNNPAFDTEQEDPAEYYFVDGEWGVDEAECLGAGIQSEY